MVMLISLKNTCATARACEPVSAANENVCETMRMIPCVIAVDGHSEHRSDFLELGKNRREYFSDVCHCCMLV